MMLARDLPAALVVITVVGGCGSESPTQATPLQPGLIIRVGSGVTDLKTGDRDSLRAFVRESNGVERLASPVWSVENESIVRIDGTSAVVAIAQGTTTIRAMAEALTASIAVTVVVNFEGTWTGFYRVERCVLLSSGGGSSYCRFAEGGQRYIRLELLQRGRAITGQIETGNNLGTTILERGTISGRVDESGQVALEGRTTSIDGQPSTSEFTGWTSQISPDGLLTGRFDRNRQFTNAFGRQASREECRLEGVTRQ
jgi:hypothetical protein